MSMNNAVRNILILIVIIIAGFGIWYLAGRPPAPAVTGAGTPIAQASFACDAGKTITASFYQGESKPSPSHDKPPMPGGSAAITLSDGRSMTLSQTISADGGRYANTDESFVFWTKGNGAFVTEGSQQTYTGCIVIAADPGSLPQTYANSSKGFSVRYPAGYAPDANYQYQELGPGKTIGGVKFTIPASIAQGTNLGADSYVSVEEVSGAEKCSPSMFIDDPAAKASQVTDNGTDYSVASTTGAGAGNRYEETVYALPGTNPCTAIRYFIHYGVIENYPAGAVRQFDHAALVSQFDAIRRTLILNPNP